MNLKQTLLLSIFTILLGNTYAQDIHNTLYNFNPLVMNPATTGAYEGTVRIGGIYRNQAITALLSESPFSTPSFFADAPILMVGKRNWLGVGIMMFQDNAGSLGQTTNAFQLSAALHLALDKKSNTIVTIGAQGGQVGRSLDCGSDFSFEDGILANNPTASIDYNMLCGGSGGGGNNDPEASGFDLNIGVLLKSKVNKTTDYSVGLSARHVIQPNLSLLSQGGNGPDAADLNLRLIGHAQLNTALNDKWSISPTIYFTNMSPASQFQIQGWGGYMINPEQNIKANFGLGYRFGDAGALLLGLDYKDLKVGVSYDLTLSDLNDVHGASGAFELAASYIIKIYKKPVVKPAIICPKL